MECLVGIKGKDFVILATDGLAARSVVAMKKGRLDDISKPLIILGAVNQKRRTDLMLKTKFRNGCLSLIRSGKNVSIEQEFAHVSMRWGWRYCSVCRVYF